MSTTSHLVNTSIDRIAALPLLGAACLLALTGCADIKPHVPQSEGHISKPAAKPVPEKVIPPPARTSTFVPPPKPAVKPQTYSVVVNEVPVKELLLALARDTKQNIDIHPGLTGLVSLNAINETLPAILDRVSKQVNMRYRMEGNTIIVSTDTPYMRTYRINYVNMTRDTTSTIGVTGDIASGGTAAGGGSTGSTGTNLSTTVVKTTVKNDFWDVLRENIRSILASTRARSLSQEERAIAAEERRAAREDALKQAEAVSRAGQAAPALLSAAFRGSAPSTLPDVKDDIIINPVTGTVSVLGTERQHQLIQQHIDSVTASAQRQVLIEATIVEVSLSEAYQGGIDWSRLELGKVGWTVSQALLGGFNAAATAAGAAAGNAFTIGYQNTNNPNRSINLTIKLLQEFGNTKVLSSPKLMALNNQTALLKVVDNIVYFEIQAQQGIITSGGSQTAPTFTTTPKTVSVGVVMGVTPQINDDGRVSLSVRPTISRVVGFKNDPNPSLCDASRQNCIVSQVPEIQTREMESVLQVGSGQTVILGGLMQDEVQRNREQVPGADKVQQPLLGEALRFRDERAAKSELIIFLRPTVVTNPSLASEELKFFERFLPQPETPPAKAGATQ